MKILILSLLAGVAMSYPRVGLVGPSGVIGPSGLVGPSGPVQFSQPAYAFLGNHAHAHVAALNTHRLAHSAALANHNRAVFRHSAAPARTLQIQPRPVHPGIIFGYEPFSGCISGPSGKVCPTGNIQYI